MRLEYRFYKVSKRKKTMSINLQNKSEVIEKYQRQPKDTGSSEVQVAIMTARIKGLTDHFSTHKKGHHSRIGLLRLVNKRRKLLTYLKSRRPEAYQNLIESLGLRR
jgi:small subunit ribosomal protein S15